VRDKAACVSRRGIPGNRERSHNGLFGVVGPIERRKSRQETGMQVSLQFGKYGLIFKCHPKPLINGGLLELYNLLINHGLDKGKVCSR
jgi:hypothetical protein